MLALILRVMTLAAVMLMPFGMGAASANSVSHAPTTAAAGHCDDQSGQPAESLPDQVAGCTAACSMLVAEPARIESPIVLPGAATTPLLAKRWASLHPEIATPPPKLS